MNVAMEPAVKSRSKLLTVHPPWAHLMALGHKTCLLMPTQSLYRGWVVLRVPQETKTWALNLALTEPFARALAPCEASWLRGKGVAVGVVRLADCYTRGRCEAMWQDNRKFGDYRPGSWLWQFSDAHALRTPVECPGKVGCHDLDVALEKEIFASAGVDLG